MDHGHGIDNRDKKTHKDKKKGKFSKSVKSLFTKEPIITPSNSNLQEFTVESDGTSYKSSDKPRGRARLLQSFTQRPKRGLMTKSKSSKDTVSTAAAAASSELITEALGLAAANTTSNVISHIEKANKALGEAIRTKKYDPAANEAVRRMKKMDKSPAMMYGKPSSPLKSGSPLAKYGCTGKH